ncbi:hypothetical protein M0R45_010143 [Rubus argutus]|uniref:Uncharacterized protein n=1 Tax=Rubus argutus TaxID=59490 RepID=A0AAW1YA05_RUBAR
MAAACFDAAEQSRRWNGGGLAEVSRRRHLRKLHGQSGSTASMMGTGTGSEDARALIVHGLGCATKETAAVACSLRPWVFRRRKDESTVRILMELHGVGL